MVPATTNFHTYYDAVIRADETYAPALGGWGRKIPKPVTLRERTLDYRVYLHDHPYVPELVRRLIRGSVAGLQDADTDYVTKPDGSLVPLQNDDGTVKKRTDGTPIPTPVLYEQLFLSASYAPSNIAARFRLKRCQTLHSRH